MSRILHLTLVLLFALALPLAAQDPFWEETGGPIPSSIDHVLIDSRGDIWVAGISYESGVNSGLAFGLYRSTNDGVEWTKMSLGGDYMNVTALVETANGDIVACAIPFTSVDPILLRLTVGGSAWMSAPSPDLFDSFVVTPGGVLYGGGTALHRSTDNGLSWSETTLEPIGTVGVLAAAPDGTILAGAVDQLYRSTDNGGSWMTVGNGGWDIVRTLVVDPDGRIFAGIDFTGIFRSTDNGTTWTPTNNGIIYTGVRTLAVDADGRLAAGYDFINQAGGGAVFLSTNNGDSWQNSGRGLEDVSVNVLAFDRSQPTFQRLYAGTDSSGVWAQIIPPTSVPAEMETAEPAASCAPNPAAVSTTLRFTLPAAANVRIDLVDMRGEQVATVVDGFRPAGENDVRVDCTGLAPGVYRYRLRAGAAVTSGTVVVQR